MVSGTFIIIDYCLFLSLRSTRDESIMNCAVCASRLKSLFGCARRPELQGASTVLHRAVAYKRQLSWFSDLRLGSLLSGSALL